MRILPLLLLIFLAVACPAQDTQPLAGTAPLTETGDFSARMVEGIGRWLEQRTALTARQRDKVWQEAATGQDWAAFADGRRERLRAILGANDRRTPGALEELSGIGAPPLEANPGGWTLHRVRWPVFDGVDGEGFLFQPAGASRAVVFVLPDADEAPERSRMALQLAAQGCLVLVPVLVDRRDNWSGSEALQRFTNQPHREWIYRQAFEMGRTLIGYEAQKAMAALDALQASGAKLQIAGAPVCLAGYGEGGLLALYTAALDDRFAATLVSGYFGPREQLFSEPIYRNVFGLLNDFGDAELAALIAPRALIVEYANAPQIEGPPPAAQGRTGAAPGAIVTPPLDAVSGEVAWANVLRAARKETAPVAFVQSPAGEPLPAGSGEALRALLAAAGVEFREGAPVAEPAPLPPALRDEMQRRTVRELEGFTQKLMRDAERARTAALWAKASPGPQWEAAQEAVRKHLAEDSIGKLPPERSPANPHSRLIREEAQWLGYEVTLEVQPEIFAWGWLLVPRDLKPGERRPVVVCQHGLEGLPQDVVTTDPKERGFGFYKGFATQLVEQGYIVYAPHNPYRGQDKFRMLQRRANPLGLSLFSFIVAQHEVATDWLASLPFVDPQRIAFYGLSYGGKTAMRVPALVPRYCLSICSGDFNEWIYKNVSTDVRMSYMFSPEWEMPEWNLGYVANYAEMAMLISPRPFMVERGHGDGVAQDEWVGYEFAKVKGGYDRLGLGDRTEIEWFVGPHTIHGVGTFDFLHRHLQWPAREVK